MNKVVLSIRGKKVVARLGIGFVELAIKKDRPENNDVSNLGINRLIGRSIEFAAEISGEENPIPMGDLYDWIDEVGIHSDEYKAVVSSFEKAFVDSMQNHIEQEEKPVKKLPVKKKATKNG